MNSLHWHRLKKSLTISCTVENLKTSDLNPMSSRDISQNYCSNILDLPPLPQPRRQFEQALPNPIETVRVHSAFDSVKRKKLSFEMLCPVIR